jgi:oxygen-independent coproporphyrinogen-3 oxidase
MLAFALRTTGSTAPIASADQIDEAMDDAMENESTDSIPIDPVDPTIPTIDDALDATRQPSVGVYLHIPFCERICPYCDFAVVATRTLEPEIEHRYVDALVRELAARSTDFEGRQLATVYFGGGTPSLLQPESVARLLGATRDAFDQHSDARTAIEITLEVNPSTIERERLPALLEVGINRLSLGIQSFDDLVLRRLGRAHRADEGRRTLEAARAAGFENLSLDLILAAPGQGFEAFASDLEHALACEPEHLSVYELTIEANTPFALADQRGQLDRAREDEVAQMLEHLATRTQEVGLLRYEISNYALPGRESGHNSRYWTRDPVLGLGVGAWSIEPVGDAFPHGARRANPRGLSPYLERIEAGEPATGSVERLTAEQARGEAMFLGLRRVAGVRAAQFAAEFGSEPRTFYLDAIEKLRLSGLLAETSFGDLRLTERGQLLSDTVFANFV